MKRISIIIMTLFMLSVSTWAQSFVIPPAPKKENSPRQVAGPKVPAPSVTRPKGQANKLSGQQKPTMGREATKDRDATAGKEVEGIERSMAISEMEQLAKNGDIDAHTQLGMYYFVHDDARALEHLKVGAEAGDCRAQYFLGGVYYLGKFEVEVDKKMAADYYLLSAEQGHSPAQYGIAICLYNGEGVQKNQQEARRWMEKAAQNNYEDAKAFLLSHSFE